MTVLPPPPPALSDLPYGTVLRAGRGTSELIAGLDFEAYSEAGYVWDTAAGKWACLPHAPQGKKGIGVTGSARYVRDRTFEVLCLGYDLRDGKGPRLWVPDDPDPEDLFAYIAAGRPVGCWNAAFEQDVWDRCVEDFGWPEIPEAQWRCTMAKARAWSLPGALAKAAEVLGTDARKDPAGKRLLDRFSVPRNPTKADGRLRIRPADDPEGARALYAYCLADVAAEMELAALIPDLSPEELENWRLDRRINRRGVQVDTVSAEACARIVESALAGYDGEMRALTGGAVERVSQVQRLIGWLAGRGVHTASLDEDTLDALTGTPDLPDDVARALELRQAGSSASVKKLFALLNAVCPDGRLRELFTYHGAHTGRTTGSGVQPTNLPGSGPSVYRCDKCRRYFAARCCPWCGADVLPKRGEWKAGAAADCLEAAGAGSPALLRGYFGDPLTAVGGCMRGLFTAAPGHRLVCSDYSAIEAVVLAELAGETWRQEVFRSHGKIYEMSAARTSGVPFEEILAHRERTEQHHPLRKTGKVQELALGYGGWIQALRDFGGDAFFASEEDMKQAILRWRSDSPAIVAFWGGQSVSDYGRRRPSLHGLEGMAVAALLDRGTEYAYQSAHGIAYVADTEALYCRLPSGRCLTYHRARLEPSERRAGEWQIVFEGWNTNPVNGPVGWITKRTYGGRLAENVVQAVSRDIQWHGMRALEAAGYPVVLHVYDEDVCEVLQDRGSVEEMERIMSDVPAWAAGWPVRATGGWFGHRYRKD